jgi:hypothetical protein
MKYAAALLVIASLVSGCAGTGFNRGEMESAAQARRPTYVNSRLSVEEIEKLRTQINLPIKLAVGTPTTSSWRGRGGQDLDTWSAEEIAEIESWKIPLQKAGIIRELYILPSNFLEPCQWNDATCTRLSVNRAAAAQVQADALVMINFITAIDEYSNPFSLLNLTILGMWFAPGHHRDALTIADGVMIDNRNEYLYAFARGEGEAGIIRPYMYADSWKAVRPSRLLALRSFGQEFIKNASQLKTK